MKNIEINARKVAKRIFIKVVIKGVRRLSFRLWLGSKLIKLGCFVIGCGVSIVREEPEQ